MYQPRHLLALVAAFRPFTTQSSSLCSFAAAIDCASIRKKRRLAGWQFPATSIRAGTTWLRGYACSTRLHFGPWRLTWQTGMCPNLLATQLAKGTWSSTEVLEQQRFAGVRPFAEAAADPTTVKAPWWFKAIIVALLLASMSSAGGLVMIEGVLLENSLNMLTRKHPRMVSAGLYRLRWAVFTEAMAEKLVDRAGHLTLVELIQPPAPGDPQGELLLRELLDTLQCVCKHQAGRTAMKKTTAAQRLKAGLEAGWIKRESYEMAREIVYVLEHL